MIQAELDYGRIGTTVYPARGGTEGKKIPPEVGIAPPDVAEQAGVKKVRLDLQPVIRAYQV